MRAGSVFGSQYGFFLSLSSEPWVKESMTYGPVASALSPYDSSLVSLACGIGETWVKVVK